MMTGGGDVGGGYSYFREKKKCAVDRSRRERGEEKSELMNQALRKAGEKRRLSATFVTWKKEEELRGANPLPGRS